MSPAPQTKLIRRSKDNALEPTSTTTTAATDTGTGTTTVKIQIKTDALSSTSQPISLDLHLQRPNINISLNIPINTAPSPSPAMGRLQKKNYVGDFDIVSTYRRLLREDPDLTMPVAAIESLVELLAYSQASTISETLDLLRTHTARLKASTPNPISLSAGTDLFQRYLISALQRPGSGGGGGPAGPAGGDFASIRQHLISNGRLFVTRAKASRAKIAAFGRHFVRDGTTVLTNGVSRVVGALLRHAAEASQGGSVRFRVIYVLGHGGHGCHGGSGGGGGDTESDGEGVVRALRAHGVPVAVISDAAVGYAMSQVDMVIVGAEGVVENGGIISRLGTFQIGLLARAARKPFYVVAESHKFVRLYPLSQYDLPIEQRVIEFRTGNDDEEGGGEGMTFVDETPKVVGEDKIGYFDAGGTTTTKTTMEKRAGPEDAVDFTPPDLISALITESGVLTPSAVSEELIKIWY